MHIKSSVHVVSNKLKDCFHQNEPQSERRGMLYLSSNCITVINTFNQTLVIETKPYWSIIKAIIMCVESFRLPCLCVSSCRIINEPVTDNSMSDKPGEYIQSYNIHLSRITANLQQEPLHLDLQPAVHIQTRTAYI